MNCPRCWHPTVKGMTSKGHRPVHVCTHCGKVWERDDMRGGYKELRLREVG